MRMQRHLTAVLAFLSLPLVHCMMPMMPAQPASPSVPGGSDPSAQGAPETTAAGLRSPASSPASPAAPQAKAASAAPSAFVPTTVEIHSDCTKTTPVFYGEKPKFGSGTKSSIGSNTTTSASRKSDGTLTVWIIDEQENGIASVHVDASTKRVEIDRSCRQITAR